MHIRKFVKSSIQKLADNSGMVLAPSWEVQSYLLGKRLARVFESYEVDCVFDVGANTGQYRDFLRNTVGYKGKIFSFEPEPVSFKVLSDRSKSDEQWFAFDYALGEVACIMTLHVMNNSSFSSFLEPSHEKTAAFTKENVVKEVIKVPVRRIDSVVPELLISHPFENAFLKLDTQGFDLSVFSGCGSSLERIVGVQTEVSFIPIYAEMPTFEESLKLFRSHDYEVSGLYPINESTFPYAIEYDCVFLRKDKSE